MLGQAFEDEFHADGALLLRGGSEVLLDGLAEARDPVERREMFPKGRVVGNRDLVSSREPLDDRLVERVNLFWRSLGTHPAGSRRFFHPLFDLFAAPLRRASGVRRRKL